MPPLFQKDLRISLQALEPLDHRLKHRHQQLRLPLQHAFALWAGSHHRNVDQQSDIHLRNLTKVRISYTFYEKTTISPAAKAKTETET